MTRSATSASSLPVSAHRPELTPRRPHRRRTASPSHPGYTPRQARRIAADPPAMAQTDNCLAGNSQAWASVYEETRPAAAQLALPASEAAARHSESLLRGTCGRLARAMAQESYGTLAGIYEWLVPESLLTPEGSVAAFAQVVDALDRGARVLDCATGTGQPAVGLRLMGFEVTASDASRAMVERTRRLAAERSVELPTVVCRWEQLVDQGWSGSFDAVFCVGNSLTHAPGQSARRTALAQMAGALRPGGMLVVTSRNWELVRDQVSGLRIAERLVERDGRRGLVVHAWTIATSWDEVHYLDVAVARIDATGRVSSDAERLASGPFAMRPLTETCARPACRRPPRRTPPTSSATWSPQRRARAGREQPPRTRYGFPCAKRQSTAVEVASVGRRIAGVLEMAQGLG